MKLYILHLTVTDSPSAWPDPEQPSRPGPGQLRFYALRENLVRPESNELRHIGCYSNTAPLVLP